MARLGVGVTQEPTLEMIGFTDVERPFFLVVENIKARVGRKIREEIFPPQGC
jgi:hypothetical protein